MWGRASRPSSRAQLGYACLRRGFFNGLTSAFSSVIFASEIRREDKSTGPFIDPEYFMNFGTELFRFAIALNP